MYRLMTMLLVNDYVSADGYVAAVQGGVVLML
jgi:hypothetical protein